MEVVEAVEAIDTCIFLPGSQEISCKPGNEIHVSFYDKTQMITCINYLRPNDKF